MAAKGSFNLIFLIFNTSNHIIGKRCSLKFLTVSHIVTDIFVKKSVKDTAVHIFGIWKLENL